MSNFASLAGRPIQGSAVDAAFANLNGDTSAASVTPSGAAKSRLLSSVFNDVANVLFYATGDGVSDDAAAINEALSRGLSVVLPRATYRCASGIVVPAGVELYSLDFSPSDPAGGAVLLFDLDVMTCLTMTSSQSGTSSVGSMTSRGITVKRAPGTPPAGSIGILVVGTYKALLEDVNSFGHAINYVLRNNQNQYGIFATLSRCHSGGCSDAHIEFDSFPGAFLTDCHFGSNADLLCNAYMRFTGAVEGPNTIYTKGCTFNQGINGSVGTCLDFKNLGPTGFGYLIVEFNIIGCHFECWQSFIQSDATTTGIFRLTVTGNAIIDDYGTHPFLNLNAATSDANWIIAHNQIVCGSIAFNDPPHYGLIFKDNQILVGAVSFVGDANSVADVGGNIYGTSVSFSGGWGSLSAIGGGLVGSATMSSTATGRASIAIQGAPLPFVPVLEFGGSSAGITYSARAGAYELHGNVCTATYELTLTSKGTATGNATLAGIPLNSNSAYTAGAGGMVSYASGMASLVGPMTIVPISGSTSANMYQHGATGVSQVTDVNFTAGSVIAGTISFFVP